MKAVEILYPNRQRCLFCGQEFMPRSWGICPECLEKLPEEDSYQILELPLGEGVAAFAYKNEARQCLLRLKFEGQTWRVRYMARWMAYALGKRKPDVVAAVPIHPLRCIQRTYAQSALLAKYTARYLGVPYESRALKRIRHSAPLYTVPPDQHAQAVAGKFAPGRDIGSLQGKHVLLVDDVCTTGSTLTVCSRLLLEAGAREVSCVCFAAAGKDRDGGSIF